MKTLLPHQIEDARFLASKKFAGNFSGMGSGKTLTALEAIRIVHGGDLIGSAGIIVVGPPISLHMWREEFTSFFCMHRGGGITPHSQIVSTGKMKLNPDATAYIMSYDIATKRVQELKALGAKVLICDESHALKTPSAKRTKAILGRGGLCESVNHAWMLTGTPSTRWNDDLFTFMARADNAGLKAAIGGMTLERFRLRFCVTQKKKFNVHQRYPTVVTVGNRNTEELNRMLFEGMAVRRELADVWAQMPPITINRLTAGLERSAELTEALKAIDGMSVDQIAQIAQAARDRYPELSTVRRLLGRAKVKASVAEIADRIDAGIKPILVGAWHTEVIDALVEALAAKKIGNGTPRSVSVASLDGRTSAKMKQAHVACFNNGTLDVLVGQISAMGVSLNLQGGSHIVCVEEDWSPAIMDQFYARCHRIGQANHVHVDIFASDTKLDKAVARIAANKKRGHNTLMHQGGPV